MSTNYGGGLLCVGMGFTRTFLENQDAKMEVKSEVIHTLVFFKYPSQLLVNILINIWSYLSSFGSFS